MRTIQGWAGLVRAGMLLMGILLAAGCRDRGGAGQAGEPVRLDSIPQNVEVRLYVATDWAWNEEDTLQVTVANGTGQPLSGDLHLFVGSPMEVLFDSGAAPPPSTLSSGEGTRVVFPLGGLAPGASREFRQAVRTPPAPAGRPRSDEADTTRQFPVRAWIAGADGRQVAQAQAQDTIRIRPGSEVVAGGCGGVKDVAVTRYGVGPLRLDMRAGDVRTLCPEARDTTWKGGEGTTERGMAVRLAGRPVTLILAGDRVQRIQVDTAGIRTATGAGVGSTLGDLRARYGRMCAGQAEGRVAVWFPTAPGVSFALDSAAVRPAGPQVDAEALPDEAPVQRMWVRAGSDDCPSR